MNSSQVTIAPHGFAYQMELDWTSSCASQTNMLMLAFPLYLELSLSSSCSALWFCAVTLERELHLIHSQEVHGS